MSLDKSDANQFLRQTNMVKDRGFEQKIEDFKKYQEIKNEEMKEIMNG